ncbi:MAG TPA: serine/threonine-protein kinase [Polyangiaceae bacterium]|nr:serine/threonine-protein kinase [Polyangiaceae bacterium]
MADGKTPNDTEDLGLSPGTLVLGKYRAERLIGRGGMGVVWLARHLRLDEDVALKFLLPTALAKPDLVTRFEREARALVKLKSPHVARVLDVEVTPSGAPFMVMEYLDGQTLAGLVRGGAALPVELVVDYLLQACEAVAEAHALGIVHRDLKPGNLFLTSGPDGSPVVKVLDFGVSKIGALDGTSSDVETKPDAIVGSPPYMSPEQLRSSKDVDPRSDVWSLGVCLFELTTGRMPFAAQNLHEHYTKLMLEPAPLPSQVRTDLPPELDSIVEKCLRREPAARYASVAELARDLAKLAPDGARSAERIERTLTAARAARPSSRSSLPAPPIALPPSGVLSGASTDRTELTGRQRSRRAWRTGLVIGAVIVAAGAALVASRGSRPHASTNILPQAPAQPAIVPHLTAAASPEPSASAALQPLATSTETSPAAARSAAPPRHVVRTSPSTSSPRPVVDLEHRK